MSACCLASSSARSRLVRRLASTRAAFSSLTTRQNSPASGTESKPMISTGTEGPASVMGLPRKSCMARTRPLGLAGHDGVADADGAALDQHGDDHAAADVDLGFDDGAARRHVGVGLEIGDVGDQLQHVEEVVEPDALLGAGLDEHRVAAPLLGHDAELGELLLDLLDVGVGLVDLVDDDDHRHLGRLGVVDGLDGLRHDAVVGGHHDGRDVGDLGAPRAHGGEGLVARRVEERDGLAVVLRPGRRRCAA